MRGTHSGRSILGLLVMLVLAVLLGAASLSAGLTAAGATSPGDSITGSPSPSPSSSESPSPSPSPSSSESPSPPPSPTPTPTPTPTPLVQTIDVVYTAWNGAALTATLVLPLGYSPETATPLPCIVQPHGRGSRPSYAATTWGDLPTRYGFAVICPDAVGRDGTGNSWAAPGQIDDLVAMPDTVEAAVPWLQLDRRRLYLVGSSMGGQEALVALARAPDRFAAVAAYDGAADLAARYRDMGAARQRKDQTKLRHEMQGTPAQRPFAYAQRSPLSFCRTLATCGVPLRIVWSTADAVVTRGAVTQFGRLCRRLRTFVPAPPLSEVITALPHGRALRDDPAGLIDFLAPGGVWRTRAAAPAAWDYAGWQRSVDVWGYHIEVPGATGTRWWRLTVAGDTITMSAPVYARVSAPWSGHDPVRVTVNGRTRRVKPTDGRIRIAFLAGDNIAVVRR